MATEREAVFLKLQEERLTALEKRKTDRKENNQTSELLREFLGKFNSIKSEINSILEILPQTTDNEEKKIKLNSGLDQADKLKVLLNDAIPFLPAYDLRRCQDAVTAVHDRIARVQQECLPKKKFGFSKKKNVAPQITKPVEEKPAIGDDTKFSKYSSDVVFEQRSNESIDIPKSDINKKDVLLKNLDNCTVNLHSLVGTLHCTNCTNCTFSVGPISGSIFLENCNSSTFHVTCQQARIHTTTGATFFIHVTSKAIIEDCKDLKFGKRVQFYDQYLEDLQESGLSNTNNWDNVDDFNWLSKDKSPNWDIIQ